MLDSTKFLAPSSDVRYYLQTPFLIDGYEACTNGHVIIFTPDGDPERCNNDYSRITNGTIDRIQKMLADMLKQVDWTPAPVVVLGDKHICGHCRGTGKVTTGECEECGGDGELTFENGYHSYFVECKSCDGSGEYDMPGTGNTCHTCDGKKELYDSYSPIVVNGMVVNPNYYEIIASEDGLELASDQAKSMLYFRAGKQVGAIMPMRGYEHLLQKEAA